MTPEETPVPGDDAIARAAREGLSHLAGSHAPLRLDWNVVVLGARRVRQRRFVVLVAACALVLATSGAAIAATTSNGDHVSIEGNGGPSTIAPFRATSTTSMPDPSTTTAAGRTSGPGAASATTPARPALPNDLVGTIDIAGIVHMGDTVPVSVTLRNVSDHPVAIVDPEFAGRLEVLIRTHITDGDGTIAHFPERDFTIAPSESHTLPTEVRIDDVEIGPVVVTVQMYEETAPGLLDLETVPPVWITVVPPGWSVGDPPDPALGEWKAAMSADAAAVASDGAVVVHADLRNVGDQFPTDVRVHLDRLRVRARFRVHTHRAAGREGDTRSGRRAVVCVRGSTHGFPTPRRTVCRKPVQVPMFAHARGGRLHSPDERSPPRVRNRRRLDQSGDGQFDGYNLVGTHQLDFSPVTTDDSPTTEVANGARRRAIVVGAGVGALVVLGVVIAVAVTRDSGRDHKVDPAATVSRPTTSTSEPSITTTAAPDSPSSGAPTSGDHPESPSAPTILQAATDLTATVTANVTTLVAEQPADFTLTVRNITDHEIVYTGEPRLRLMVAFDAGGYEYSTGPPDFRLAAGEQRTFSLRWTPHPSDVGPARVSGVVVTMAGYGDRPHDYPVIISGGAAVPITVVPPGWVEGQPLDPTQGKWTVTLSGDSLIVHAGEPAIVHTTIRNVGEQAQKTRGYGALAVTCRQWNVGRPPAYEVYGLVDATVLPAGATRTFSVEILIDKQFAGQLACRPRIFFHATPNDYMGVIPNVEALLRFVVRPPLRTTTTSAPPTTTTLP